MRLAVRVALLVALLVALMIPGRTVQAQDAPLPSSTLDLRAANGEWFTFWSSSSAPVTWRVPVLARATRWRAATPGVEWGELELRGAGEAWRTRLVVARVEPARVRLRLDTAFTATREADWTLSRAPRDAVLAVNAGQFTATMPWGWVALDGRRWLPPQTGPLSAALAQDGAGRLHWVAGPDVAAFAASRTITWAFQSYPVLVASDSVVLALRSTTGAVSTSHRDARAAICLDAEGRLVVALTRFDGAGSRLGFLPLGLTAPEMAGVMAALGCRNAMLLDGGISARLRVRDAAGNHDWEGLRKVPLGLVALPR